MWFLIKAVFGFALILLVLPFFSSAPEAAKGTAPEIEMGATIEAAKSAIDDLTGICQRRPDVCKTGGEALAALGSQARAGALIAYRFLDDRFGGADGVVTGTIGKEEKSVVPATAIPSPAPEAISAAAAGTAPARPAVAAHPAGAVVLPHPYTPPAR
ncbi:MAG TPA: DUF5330 domain-containing protein [Burkholderiales bacterium]|nr:DUF5330 domain-containing protein [Burkholderiales bacterium]